MRRRRTLPWWADLTEQVLEDIELAIPSHLTRAADISGLRFTYERIPGIFDGPSYIFGKYRGALK